MVRIEDRNRFEALVPRIYKLGWSLPADMKEFHDVSACPPARLPEDLTDVNAMLLNRFPVVGIYSHSL